jgi:hypothetical protein
LEKQSHSPQSYRGCSCVIAIVPLLRPNTRFEKTKQLRKDIEAGELTANDRQKLKEEYIELRDEISQEDNEKLLEDKNLVRLWEKTEPKEYMNITTHSSLVNIGKFYVLMSLHRF